MPLKTPSWWYRKTGAISAALSSLAALYGRVAASRLARGEAYRSWLPVICIGNFTAGGGGKTPTAIAVASLLKAMGKNPAFLTRGYGGTAKGVVRVAGQAAEAVGDEPLLLAAVAPTFVSADRVAGAKAIEESDADVIVMDDGFQNPTLAKDLSLLVVDGGYGFGNGRVQPAGPLREGVAAGLARADAVVLIEPDERQLAPRLPAGMPLLRDRGGIEIDYVAGFGNDASAVPVDLKQAVLSLIGYWFEHRDAVVIAGSGAVVPPGFDRLVSVYREVRL